MSLANFYDNRLSGVCNGVTSGSYWTNCCGEGVAAASDLCFVCYICGLPGGIAYQGTRCLQKRFEGLYPDSGLPHSDSR